MKRILAEAPPRLWAEGKPLGWLAKKLEPVEV